MLDDNGRDIASRDFDAIYISSSVAMLVTTHLDQYSLHDIIDYPNCLICTPEFTSVVLQMLTSGVLQMYIIC
jgi:hypothetical protein